MKKLNYLLKYSFLIFNLLFLTSCGEEESETGDSNPDASIKMTAVSPTSQNLHFGEEANIQVLLTKTEVGGLAGEKIDFQLVGNSGGSALIDPRNKASKAAIKTDLDGFATLALKAGKQETQFNLRVKHTSGANKIFIMVFFIRFIQSANPSVFIKGHSAMLHKQLIILRRLLYVYKTA